MPRNVIVINVRLPLEAVEWMDSLIEKGIYKSRSEVIRDFSRNYVEKNKRNERN